MVGIQGIGGIAEPANPRRVAEREKTGQAVEGGKDAVELSPLAGFAAKAAEEASLQDELRDARIQEIRDALDRGTYQIQQVVLQVAARLGRYLEA